MRRLATLPPLPRTILLTSLLAIAFATPARANFLINPSGGTNFAAAFDADDPDDGSVLRSLGGSFSLYGTSISSIYVNANGFLSVYDGFGLLADRGVGALAGIVPGPDAIAFMEAQGGATRGSPRGHRPGPGDRGPV